MIEAQDGGQPGATATQEYLVTVDEPASGPTITTSYLPTATVGQPYSLPFTATNGTGPYTWSIPSGSLPSGLTFDPTTGTISGTPTQPGTSSIEFQVTDKNGLTSTVVLPLTIAPAPEIVTTSLPVATSGIGYSTPIVGVSGVGPYQWSLVGGTLAGTTWTGGGLPAGVSLSQSSGVLTGVTSGPSGTFTVQLQDQNGSKVTQMLTLDVLPSPAAGLEVLTTELPVAFVGGTYSTAVIASGGSPGYTWSIVSGSLPAWATLDTATGTISGTPDNAGVSTVTLEATDTASDTAQSVVLTLTCLGPLAIETTGLTQGVVGEPYSTPLAAQGGTGALTWSIVGGELPPGLSLDGATGEIVGDPSITGSFPITIEVLDAKGDVASKLFTLVIGTPPPSPRSPPTITTTTLPGGGTSGPYTGTAVATGGTGPYTWSVVSGSLPPGLSLDPATGTISGLATASGSFTFTLKVEDADGLTATQSFTIVIAATAAPAPPAAPAIGIQGGGTIGCAVGRANGSPIEVVGLLVVLALMVVRRARKPFVGTLVVLVGFAGTARADSPDGSGMNLNQVYMPVDGHGFYVVDDPTTLELLQVHGFLNASYAYDPLEARIGNSNHEDAGAILRRQGNFDLGAAIGLLPKDFVIPGLSVGFDLPVNFLNDGEQVPFLERSLGSGGVGQLRLEAKADLVEVGDGDLGLSIGLKPFLTLPTGKTDEYLSDREDETGGAMFLAAGNLWRIRLGGQLGYEVTPRIRLLDVAMRDRIRFGFAAEFFFLREEAPWATDPDLKHSLSLGVELFGWTDGSHPWESDVTRPVEILGFLRYTNTWGFLVELGYGNGFDHGISAPQYRMMARVGFTFG